MAGDRTPEPPKPERGENQRDKVAAKVADGQHISVTPGQRTDLAKLLGPENPTWWNDHRANIGDLMQAHSKQLAAPITDKEFDQAKKILKLDENASKTDVRLAVTIAAGLKPNATDAEIRAKLERPNPLDSGKPANEIGQLEIKPIEWSKLKSPGTHAEEFIRQ